MFVGKLDFIKSKVISDINQFKKTIAQWKFKQEKIVFTNGCFDLLHRGHIEYLAEAAQLGDRLVIGLNADASVKTLNKGINRPIKDEDSRAIILAALHYTDAVILFSEPTPLKLINEVKPDVLVKGGDWKVEQIIGSKEVKSWGGETKTIPFLEGYSTTSIEQKILNGESKS